MSTYHKLAMFQQYGRIRAHQTIRQRLIDGAGFILLATSPLTLVAMVLLAFGG